MSVKAIVLIKAQTDQVSRLARSIAEVAGVSEVYSVAGQYDLVALVHARDNEGLTGIVSDGIRRLEGISYSETLIAFRTLSKAQVATTHSVGLD
ncbi:MAG: Lrp/AsnC ligand binding domain-containing protein [Steroidobacteraceae bacterium]